MRKAVVVIPTYNEAGNMEQVIKGIFEATEKITNWSVEVLVVDSNSSDNTGDVVKKIKEKRKQKKEKGEIDGNKVVHKLSTKNIWEKISCQINLFSHLKYIGLWKIIYKINIGLDEKKRKWLNQTIPMKFDTLKKTIEGWSLSFKKEKSTRLTPQDREYEALRESMRGQFQQLKDKGLSIRIVQL